MTFPLSPKDDSPHVTVIMEKINAQLVENGKKYCSTCKLKKAVTDFNQDSTKSSGYTSRCKTCKKSYSDSYYDANSAELIEAELARREGKPKPKGSGSRIRSKEIRLRFGPAQMKEVLDAFRAENGRPASEEELTLWLTRYARAGVLGQARYINEKKRLPIDF